MVFTDDKEVAEKLKSIRVHGKGSSKYDNVRLGINGRLDTIQAAILLAKFEIFPDEIEKRQNIAKRYNDALKDKFYLQEVPAGYKSAWAQYSIRPKNGNRDYYLKLLKENDIPSAIYYPKPLHLQKVFSHLGYNKDDLLLSGKIAEDIFSIPFHPYLKEGDQNIIINLLVNC